MRAFMDLQQSFYKRQSRRRVLRQFGMLAGMSVALDACSWNDPSPTSTATAPDSIQHVIIACQENHSFDMYFGYYPRAGKFGIPPDYSQPDGKGGTVKPYHFSSPTSADLAHSSRPIQRKLNHGPLNAFFTPHRPTPLGS